MRDLRELLEVGRVVELVDGEKYYVLTDRLIGCDGWMKLSDYSRNLECTGYDVGFNVAKIFNAPMDEYGCWNFGMNEDEDGDGLELIWERPEKKMFSTIEIIIAENIGGGYKYIARDKNQCLCVYTHKPWKDNCEWDNGISGVARIGAFNHLFQQITFEDNEPTLISDIINSKNCQ